MALFKKVVAGIKKVITDKEIKKVEDEKEAEKAKDEKKD